MKVTTVGGGPGGLYASLLLKRENPDWDVTVHERNPRGVTYGWGIVLPGRTLPKLEAADEPSYEAIDATAEAWEPFDTLFLGERFRCDGNRFRSMLRADLLDLLQERCLDVGVDLRFESPVENPREVAADADLLIAADGIHSRTRETYADEFETSVLEGDAPFSWFGTDADFDALTHAFVEDDAGLWCAHAYPGPTSTFIVDCDAETWANSDVPEMDEEEYLDHFADLFSEYLDGHGLRSQRDRWQRFTTVRNGSWHHDNVVLLGDAAHTAHYSIGSGTTLAMEDAIGLADAFAEHGEVETALPAYERARKPAADQLQLVGERSRIHFEHIRRFTDLPPLQFAVHHLSRSGRLTYGSLAGRDPDLIASLDEWFAANATPGEVPVRAPARQPYDLGGTRLNNRLVRALAPGYAATDGTPDPAHLDALAAAGTTGAGLVLTDPVAVSASGRPTAGSPGLYEDDHEDAWGSALDRLPDGVAAGAVLTHAGASAARDARPLSLREPGARDDSWTPPRRHEFPTPPRAFAPDVLTEERRADVRESFAAAAERASAAGFDHVQLDAGSGVLGDVLAAESEFATDVVATVRDRLPDSTSLGVALEIGGGLSLDGAFAVAETVASEVDIVATTDGGDDSPEARVQGAGGYSDNVRNETGVPTMAAGHATSMDTANTLIATGRADLCTYYGSVEESE